MFSGGRASSSGWASGKPVLHRVLIRVSRVGLTPVHTRNRKENSWQPLTRR